MGGCVGGGAWYDGGAPCALMALDTRRTMNTPMTATTSAIMASESSNASDRLIASPRGAFVAITVADEYAPMPSPLGDQATCIVYGPSVAPSGTL